MVWNKAMWVSSCPSAMVERLFPPLRRIPPHKAGMSGCWRSPVNGTGWWSSTLPLEHASPVCRARPFGDGLCSLCVLPGFLAWASLVPCKDFPNSEFMGDKSDFHRRFQALSQLLVLTTSAVLDAQHSWRTKCRGKLFPAACGPVSGRTREVIFP